MKLNTVLLLCYNAWEIISWIWTLKIKPHFSIETTSFLSTLNQRWNLTLQQRCIWVDTNSFVLLLICLRNYELCLNVEKTTTFQSWSNIILWTLNQRLWGVLQNGVLQTFWNIKKLRKILDKLEPTGGANTLIWKNIWGKTLWVAVWNYAVIPEDEQSKKIQCIQDWKYVTFAHGRKGYLQIWMEPVPHN